MSGGLDTAALRRRVAHDAQIARLDQVEVREGPARGSRALLGRTPSGLRFRVALDRGFDLEELEFRGRQLGWHGPSGLVAPDAASPDQEGGLGLLRAFSGFLITCGYDHFGPARTGPADHFGYGLRERQAYPLHGRAAFLPATLTRAEIVWDEPGEPAIVITGEVRQAGLFGEVLVNRRRYVVPLERPELTIEDRVTNEGLRSVPHRMLYHVNLGWPLVDVGTLVSGLPEDSAMPSPIPAGVEPVERFRFVTREACAESVTVANPALDGGLALSLTPASPSLRHVGQWWNPYAGMSCLGVEPASAPMPPPGGEPWHPDRWLEPGETETYRLAFRVEAPE